METYMVFSNNPGFEPFKVAKFSKNVHPESVEFVGSLDSCNEFLKIIDSDNSEYQCQYDYACGYVN